jgi:uncharacterized protein YjdB
MMIGMKKGKKEFLKLGVIGVTLFLFPVLILFGCSREVSWIHAEPKSVALKEMGETVQIKFAPLDKENKPVPDAKLVFQSTNPKVAVVSETGLITAKGSGNTIISIVSEKGEKAVIQCKVAIRSAIKIEPTEAIIKSGEKVQLSAKVLDEKGDLFEDQVVSWASSDHSVAVVNDFGEVTGVASGTAKIIGTQINAYSEAVITVEPAN